MAICTGCGITSEKAGVYDEANRVEDDGSFADGKFVCDNCYCELIMIGKDIATPQALQENAKKYCRKSPSKI